MATISSAGIGSGLQVESIIQSLVSLERKPIELLQTEKTKMQTQLSTFGRLQSAMSTLRDTLRTLGDAPTWNAVTGASSDAAAVAVSVGANSIASSYQVSVSRLASAQQLASRAYADSSQPVGQGTLTIELGRWGTAPAPSDDPEAPPAPGAAFIPKDGATAVSITIGPEDDTLAKVRDRINGAGAGVTASIVNDANGARLTLRSTATGAENAFRITVEDGDGDASDGNGLSALAYDPLGAGAPMTRNQEASNAEATINGLPVSSPSNTLGDVIDGLTLTLGKVTTVPGETVPTAVQVTVNTDTAAIKKSVTDFVSAYNEIIKLLREQTRYNEADAAAAPLQGDSTAISLQRQLRTLVGGSTGASEVLTRLSDIGLDPQQDGTLKITGSKLDSAIGNLPELRKMFATTDSDDAANDGFAQQLRRYADAVLGADGAIASRQEGIRKRIERNGDRQEQLEDRIALVEKRLRAQYTALDGRMAQLNGLSTYLTQQLAQLNKT